MGRFMALTTFNNQTYISMHGYYVQDWWCIPIVFSIKCIIKRSNAQNMIKVILVVHLLILGAWHKKNIKSIIVFWCKWCEYFSRCSKWCYSSNSRLTCIHYMAHKTNLTILTFFGLLWWHNKKTYFDIFVPLSASFLYAIESL